MDRHARGVRSGCERTRGASARLAMLVAALVLAIGSCGLADSVTKSRTDSMRGASWPGADTDEVTFDGVAVVHTGTPSPDPTTSPSSFYGAFEPPPDGAHETDDDGPVPPAPDRIFWPLPTPDDPEYKELDHSPEPDPEPDPCDAVGVVPDECDPEPEPEPTPCDDSADSCDPPGCEEPEDCSPPDCDDEPTSAPTSEEDGSGSGGAREPTPASSGSPDPTQTQTPDPSPSPSPSDPPGDGEPGC